MVPALAEPLSIGQCATLACLLEATAPKPGNVHRGADFEDVTYLDFVISAVTVGPILERAARDGVGATILAAVQQTRQAVGTNTNLGTLLLLAPLARSVAQQPLRGGMDSVLQSLTPSDAASVYEAIRIARPGGMGTVPDMDLAGPAPAGLLEAMQRAADRDLVARQFVTGFSTVFDEVVPALTDPLHAASPTPVTAAILHAQMLLMSRHPDSLIARKCGSGVAQESASRAAQVLESGPPGSASYLEALAHFDFWLRSDHHRRNPGTTADLIAAGLFVALRDELLAPPYR